MNGKIVVAGLGIAALVGILVWRTRKVEAHEGRRAPASGLADVDGDGWVTEEDVAAIKQAYLTEGTTLTDEEFDRADVNQNGRIDIGDYLMAKRYFIGDLDLA